MKILKKKTNIMCDTVLCNTHSDYVIECNSYKGNIYLCEKCYNALKSNMKRIKQKDEQKAE